jgi:endoglucanase
MIRGSWTPSAAASPAACTPPSRRRSAPRPVGPAPSARPLPRWISVAGLEFGTQRTGFCNAFPGRLGQDFFLNRAATFERLAEAGFRSFRIPFRWERIQPQLMGALDPDGVQHLRLLINLARRAGGEVLLDLHNYGRYAQHVDGEALACGLEEEFDGRVLVGAQHLADLWARMAHAFSGIPGILGYGLMNEPHDLPDGAWVAASQAATAAIRAEGDQTPLFVAGERWSSAAHWSLVNPAAPWIEDPLGRVTYEAHCYLDQNGAGEYHHSYTQELEMDSGLTERGEKRLEPFLNWLEENDADGFLGEFAVPAQDHRWCALLPRLLNRLDAARVQTAWWAAGERWGDYALSLQPKGDADALTPAQAQLFRN